MTRPVVLLIDSDEAQRRDRGETVRQAGCWLLPATTLDEAVVLCSKVRPALILTTPSFVGGDVRGLLSKIRLLPPLTSVPVVVLAEIEPDTAAPLRDDGVLWVHPPPAPHDLAALVEEQTRRTA